MPLRVRNLLEQLGDELILKIQLGRTPVQGFPIKILNFLSHSKFTDKQLELGYDEIYHNYLLITIKNSQGPHTLQHMLGNIRLNVSARTILKLEKAQRIALKPPSIPDELIDVYDIPLTPDKPLTLNRLISTASNVDKNFYTYDAGENNMCQTFVENIIDINGQIIMRTHIRKQLPYRYNHVKELILNDPYMHENIVDLSKVQSLTVNTSDWPLYKIVTLIKRVIPCVNYLCLNCIHPKLQYKTFPNLSLPQIQILSLLQYGQFIGNDTFNWSKLFPCIERLIASINSKRQISSLIDHFKNMISAFFSIDHNHIDMNH
ncbi:unnamed protein product [Rotaria sp. Silwood1]|nr:unnamed protein product [Rotaria sp. Silwood1]CAF4632606.1 unnamed protein product [Rotaria sp. Silwood1]CAF4746734.1 unnamed protein product [Rotaria sp. Silwood1]